MASQQSKIKSNNKYKKAATFFALVPSLTVGMVCPGLVQAQTIVPAADGTNTIVTPSGNSIDISGGQSSGDGANLFHSFTKFGLDSGQVANFLSNPAIRNILGRINGGDASIINGLIQVSNGTSNLFLINPSGIVFGNNASLNVPASFSASTATGIGFGNNNWFSATGSNNYAALAGTPNTFAFNASQPGAIINAAPLAVGSGGNLSLVGGTVVSTGQLSAPGGKVTVATVPGLTLVRLTPAGSLLGVEIQPLTTDSSQPNNSTLPIASLPSLLTGGNASSATQITKNNDGSLQLSGSGIAIQTGDVVVAGGNVTGAGASLSANRNLTLVETKLQTAGDLNLFAQDTVRIRDSVANPFLAKTGGNLYVEGKQSIDILALNHTKTEMPFQSGGNTSVVTDGIASLDAHFSSGGNFYLLNLSGGLGKSISLYDPIYKVDGDYNFGDYTGAALKVEAGGNITFGNIKITQPDTAASISENDTDFKTLTTTPALILKSATGSITAGDINTSGEVKGDGGPVIMSAQGNITAGTITSSVKGGNNGGSVSLSSKAGNIITDKINTTAVGQGNSGNVTLRVDAGSIKYGTINATHSGNPGKGNQGYPGNITLASKGSSQSVTGGAVLSPIPSPIPTPNDGNSTNNPPSGTGDTTPPTGDSTSNPQPNTGDTNPATGTGTSNPTTGDTTSNPQPNTSDTNPPTGTNTSNPTTGDNASNPIPGTGNSTSNPTTGTGNSTSNPTPGNSTSNPTTGTGNSASNPTTGNSASNPTPGTGNSTSNPTIGNSASNPTPGTGNSTSNPTIGNSASNPTPGNNTSNPTMGTGNNTSNPTMGTGNNTSNPTTGTGTSNPTTGTGNSPSNPTTGNSASNPTPGNSVSNPTTGNSVSNPTTGNSASNPTTGTGNSASNPTTGNSASNPTTGNSASNPTTGNSASNPTTGNSASNPTPGNSASNPTTGNSASNPTTGNSASNPTTGNSASNPTTGNSASNPTPGNSASNPTPGNSASNPTTDNSASNPTTDNSASNPITGINTNSQPGNSDTNPTTGNNTNPTTSNNASNPQPNNGDSNPQPGNNASNPQPENNAGNTQPKNGNGNSNPSGNGNSNPSGNSDKKNQSDNSDKKNQSDNSDKKNQSDNSDKKNQSDNSDKKNQSDNSDKKNQSDNSDKKNQSDNSDKKNQSDNSDKKNQSDNSGKTNPPGVSTKPKKQGDCPGKQQGDCTGSGPARNGMGYGRDRNGKDNSVRKDTDNVPGNGVSNSLANGVGSSPGMDSNNIGGNKPLGNTNNRDALTTPVQQSQPSMGIGQESNDVRSLPQAAGDSAPSRQVSGESQSSEQGSGEATSSDQGSGDSSAPVAKKTGSARPQFVISNAISSPDVAHVAALDKQFSTEWQEYFGSSANIQAANSVDATQILDSVQEATNIRSALIYVAFVPPNGISQDARAGKNSLLSGTNNAQNTPQVKTNTGGNQMDAPNRMDQKLDELDVTVVMGHGQVIRKRIVGATRSQVLRVAAKFRSEVTNARRPLSYQAPAQQLYNWLVSPIEGDLQAADINNLVFIMDEGLRSLPVAALHDGKGFLVERYSAGLMPSLNLTDTKYRDIRNSQVMAMGAANLPNQRPLPAVPVEIENITQHLWSGKSYLNSAFTFDNLKSARSQRPFGIVHLATHAEFQVDDPKQSYIQLWDSKLRLEQLSQLGWNDPPVDLLVLSACQTALGDRKAELGFAGLALQSGVKSALASLWYVSDEGTLGLMTNFYEQLRKAPIKAEALRQAQLAMIKGDVRLENGYLLTPGGKVQLPPEMANLKTTKLTHPYYWAAFTMIGNPW
ncbi:CHAT domain-containing protein [Microcoleus sp. FACHB-831]|uniref:CHAT domain-containing protein n=1 Tax=Microcoleus sp. FACHB-831 TaxID=2692827 RepID=UPI001688B2F1|nr:CHAT domain-containing protein [Microcoleus sp. FACHB-831]MBD1923601.1 CHAT domain-containing protein [Microcoleus sp. FACHB-831]